MKNFFVSIIFFTLYFFSCNTIFGPLNKNISYIQYTRSLNSKYSETFTFFENNQLNHTRKTNDGKVVFEHFVDLLDNSFDSLRLFYDSAEISGLKDEYIFSNSDFYFTPKVITTVIKKSKKSISWSGGNIYLFPSNLIQYEKRIELLLDRYDKSDSYQPTLLYCIKNSQFEIRIPAVGLDGSVYLQSKDSHDDSLCKFNKYGFVEKSISIPQSRVSPDLSIGSDGTIYCIEAGQGGGHGFVVAFNPDLTVKWKSPPPEITGEDLSIVCVSKNNLLYTISTYGTLCAFDLSGNIKWTLRDTITYFQDPIIAPDGTIYCVLDRMQKHGILAVNPDGTKKWVLKLDTSLTLYPSSDRFGTIYVGCIDKNIYAIDKYGSTKWKLDIGVSSNDYSGGIAIGSDGTIFFVAYDRIIAITADGIKKWEFVVPYKDFNQFHGTPALGSDGILYIGHNNGNVYAINPDGSLKWIFSTNVISPIVSPMLDKNGILYFYNMNLLFAIQTNSKGYMDSAWPMYRHDPQHTGQAN